MLASTLFSLISVGRAFGDWAMLPLYTTDYLTVRQTAEKWGIAIRTVQNLLHDGRIPGAVQPARDWLIPKDAEKPLDERRNNYRRSKKKDGTDGKTTE